MALLHVDELLDRVCLEELVQFDNNVAVELEISGAGLLKVL